jgi:hypothetical protein
MHISLPISRQVELGVYSLIDDIIEILDAGTVQILQRSRTLSLSHRVDAVARTS